MKSRKDFFEFGKEQLENMKKIFEEVEVQLNLGKKEAKEAFEKEMKNFSEFVKEQKKGMKQKRTEAKSQIKELNKKLEALQTSLGKEPPKTKKPYGSYKDKVLLGIYEVEYSLKGVFNRLTFGTRARLQKFKMDLDNFRLTLALSSFEQKDKPEKYRVVLKKDIKGIRKKLQKEEEEDGKFDSFVDEITNSFEHLKKAFTDLF